MITVNSKCFDNEDVSILGIIKKHKLINPTRGHGKLWWKKDMIDNIFEKNIDNPNFYFVLGHLVGDGGWSGDNVYYTNNSIELINLFKSEFSKIFGWEMSLFKDDRCCYRLQKHSRYLTEKLNGFDIKIIKRKSRKCKIKFLQALYDDEGSINNYGQISLCSKDKFMILLIKELLVELSFKNLFENKLYNRIYNKYYYILYIRKEYELFYKLISFRQKEKKYKLKDIIKSKDL